MKLELRDGQSQQFSAGQMFIAQDYLEDGQNFDSANHGHRPQVIGDSELNVLRLKLEKRN